MTKASNSISAILCVGSQMLKLRVILKKLKIPMVSIQNHSTDYLPTIEKLGEFIFIEEYDWGPAATVYFL